MVLDHARVGAAVGRRRHAVVGGELFHGFHQLRIIADVRAALLVRLLAEGAGDRGTGEAPGSADLNHLAGLDPAAGAVLLKKDGAARVADDVVAAAGCVRGLALRGGGFQVDPGSLRADLVSQLLARFLELGGRVLDLLADAAGHAGRQLQRLDLHLTYHQGLEAGKVLRRQRGEDFLADLFRRNDLPNLDAAVLGVVDAPLAAAGIEPAVLVGPAAEGGVGLAVDFDAVLVVGPDVDLVVVVAVEEEAQDGALVVLELPTAALARSLDELDLAIGLGLGGRGRVIDAVLALHRGGGMSGGQAAQHQQTTRQQAPPPGYDGHP